MRTHSTAWMRTAITLPATHPFLLIPLLFYGYTCATAITFGDTALHVSRIHDASFSTHVNGHPIMVAWGWLFSLLPLDSPAHKANLVSAVFGALAICIFYFCILQLHRSRLVAAASASLLMLNHSMWWHSTIIEPYAFNALFTVIGLGLFVRMSQETNQRAQQRFLRGLFLVGGLATLSHIQMGFLCLGAGASLIASMALARQDAWRNMLSAMAWFLVGFLPWLALFVVDWFRYQSFAEAVQMAFVGHFAALIMRGSFLDAVSDMTTLTLAAYPSPFLVCALLGIVPLIRSWKSSPVPAVGLAVFFAATTVFFMFYNTWDKFAFLLPSWCILAFAGSFSIRWMAERIKAASGSKRAARSALALAAYALSLFLPIYVYGHMAQWGSGGVFRSRFHDRPESLYRVGTFWWNPNKRSYTDVEDYADALFAALPRNAVLIDEAGRTFHTMTLYFQGLLAQRRDVMIVQFNNDGIPGWGYTEDQLARTVVSAALTNRDLFMDPGSPAYHTMLRKFQHERGIRFERLPLDPTRTVARLVVRGETDGSDLQRIAENSGFRQIPIEKLRPVYEPVPADVSLALNVSDLAKEGMRQFGGSWENDDQMLVAAPHDRAEISIILISPSAMAGTLAVGYTTSSDYGKVALTLNHAPLGAVEDLYASTPGTLQREYSDAALQAGVNVLTFRIHGKHSLSGGHSFGLDWIGFR